MNPVILATWTFGAVAVRAGFGVLATGGSSLDAVEQGARAVEADPAEDSVGLGGIPDAWGRITLDASIMLSPARAAGVACVRSHLHPISIARRLMETGPPKLLVAEGAEAFAAEHGFEKSELMTPQTQEKYDRWRSSAAERARIEGVVHSIHREEESRRILAPKIPHDTVGVVALDQRGVLAGACSTSGWPFKLPGRVGDSPIIGHGLYVHPAHGAAVCTGRGELAMSSCAAFLAIERLRAGDSPAAAARAALDRIREGNTLTEHDQVAVVVLARDGRYACDALADGFTLAVGDSAGERTLPGPFAS